MIEVADMTATYAETQIEVARLTHDAPVRERTKQDALRVAGCAMFLAIGCVFAIFTGDKDVFSIVAWAIVAAVCAISAPGAVDAIKRLIKGSE